MKQKTFTVSAHCDFNVTFKVKANVELEAQKKAEELAERIYVKFTPIGFAADEVEPPAVYIDDVSEDQENTNDR